MMPRHCPGSRSCLPHRRTRREPWPDPTLQCCILLDERFSSAVLTIKWTHRFAFFSRYVCWVWPTQACVPAPMVYMMPRHCAGSRSCLPHPSKKKLPWPDLAFHSCILPAERFLHQLCRPPHKPKTVPLFHGTLVESDLRQLAPQHPCDISIQDIPPVPWPCKTSKFSSCKIYINFAI